MKALKTPSHDLGSAANRRSLKNQYRRLFVAILAVLKKHDPIGLVKMGAPPDEYEPEVGTILPRLRSCASEEDVLTVVRGEFLHWFGQLGNESVYPAIARDVWSAYEKRKEA